MKMDRQEEFNVWKSEKKGKDDENIQLNDFVKKGLKAAEQKTDLVAVNKTKKSTKIHWLRLIVCFIIIIAILGIIIHSSYDPSKVRYQYVDIEAKNISGLPMNVFYKNKLIFSLSGWESNLEYGNVKDRLYGNEQYKKIVFDDKGRAYTEIILDSQVKLEPLTTDPIKATRIGWFVGSDSLEIANKAEKNHNEISVSLSKENLNSNIRYNLLKNKQYFNAEFSSEAENYSELGYFAYGFLAAGFDVYLPNGKVLKNDNSIIKTDKKIDVTIEGNVSQDAKSSLNKKIPKEILSRNVIERKGSYYAFDALNYEIFLNNNQQGFMVFSDAKENRFESLFQWNVFRIYVLPEKGMYPKVYFIVLDNANIAYDDKAKDWVIKDSFFNGKARDYIKNAIEASKK